MHAAKVAVPIALPSLIVAARFFVPPQYGRSDSLVLVFHSALHWPLTSILGILLAWAGVAALACWLLLHAASLRNV